MTQASIQVGLCIILPIILIIILYQAKITGIAGFIITALLCIVDGYFIHDPFIAKQIAEHQEDKKVLEEKNSQLQIRIEELLDTNKELLDANKEIEKNYEEKKDDIKRMYAEKISKLDGDINEARNKISELTNIGFNISKLTEINEAYYITVDASGIDKSSIPIAKGCITTMKDDVSNFFSSIIASDSNTDEIPDKCTGDKWEQRLFLVAKYPATIKIGVDKNKIKVLEDNDTIKISKIEPQTLIDGTSLLRPEIIYTEAKYLEFDSQSKNINTATILLNREQIGKDEHTYHISNDMFEKIAKRTNYKVSIVEYEEKINKAINDAENIFLKKAKNPETYKDFLPRIIKITEDEISAAIERTEKKHIIFTNEELQGGIPLGKFINDLNQKLSNSNNKQIEHWIKVLDEKQQEKFNVLYNNK